MLVFLSGGETDWNPCASNYSKSVLIPTYAPEVDWF